jgi:hypothetical protein
VDDLAVDPTGEWAAVSNWGASSGPGGAGVVVVARRTPMPPARFCSASANSSGAPGRLEVVSIPSVAAGSLDFEVHDVPAFTFGILVYGPTRTSLQLGDGTLCIKPRWVRLDVAQANAGGVMSLSFDYTLAPPADPVVLGNGWVFQALYRDPPGGVAGFNLTDALKIWFCP